VAELRWLLLVVGLVIIAGIYFYTRFKPRLDKGIERLTLRREPTLGGAAEAATKSTHLSIESDESARAEPEPEPEPEPPITTETKIVAIRLMARNGGRFPADKLILKMREMGLKHGEFGIFHRPCEAEERRNDFSVASLVEPGSFDLTKIKTESYPGVSIFMTLPGARDGVEIFDDMLTTSRSLARELDGELLDEQGSSLSVQRERYLREEVIQFEHQTLS
jgi:cell division protein ZipA